MSIQDALCEFIGRLQGCGLEMKEFNLVLEPSDLAKVQADFESRARLSSFHPSHSSLEIRKIVLGSTKVNLDAIRYPAFPHRVEKKFNPKEDLDLLESLYGEPVQDEGWASVEERTKRRSPRRKKGETFLEQLRKVST